MGMHEGLDSPPAQKSIREGHLTGLVTGQARPGDRQNHDIPRDRDERRTPSSRPCSSPRVGAWARPSYPRTR
jgi:hypothetical protein